MAAARPSATLRPDMLVSDPTPVERGKAARKAVPRRSHAEFTPAPGRTDPVETLERQSLTRVAELIPIRYGRMLTSPFAFYRGAAAIMAEDLASTPQSGLLVQACGDAHLSNFGVFGSSDRRLVFDLNDFDETLSAPWEWDVKRLAASMAIAAQTIECRGREQRRIVLECVAAYRTAMAGFAAMSNLDVWYARFEIESVLDQYAEELAPRAVKRVEKGLAKARTKDSRAALSKLTHVVDGELRIIDQPPLIVPIDRLAEGARRTRILTRLRRIMDTYRDSLPAERRVLFDQFELVDLARRVVGVGSVGIQAWIALLVGAGGDPLFLQIKEAKWSVLEDHAGASAFANQGKRVVVGQRLMQASSDIFLGWLRADCDYYVRQLKDWKLSADIERMRPDGMTVYGRMCGWTLARAHARTGDRVAIAAYLGSSDSFDRAILEFAEAYAEQNLRDYQAVVDAAAEGRITRETDPNVLGL
jgi:uncharacterized protein (DUF2252 family)